VEVKLGPQLGFAQARLGKTTVSASVTCEIVRPNMNSPTEGSIVFTTVFGKISTEHEELSYID
jgi:exosome complex RNA-binding protein Rrp42 (RNase PH superfamily)